MRVDFVVDDADPEGGVLWENFFEVFDSLSRSDDRGDVKLGGVAFCEQSAIAEFHRGACSEHRVDEDEGFAFEARRGEVFDEDVEAFFFFVLAIG